MLITSTSNPRIKQIRKLLDRKERQKTGLFYIEGVRIVTEAIHSDWEIEYLIYSKDLIKSEFGTELVRSALEREMNVVEVSPDVFKYLSLKDGPQGIAAVLKQKQKTIAELVLNKGDLWVALDSVADPGNLGTILRTCDAVGARGVILLDHSTDPYDPSVVRASMGAFFSQQMISITSEMFNRWSKENQVVIIGTSDKAGKRYNELTYPDSFILLMGSEREGLSPRLISECNELVSIPMVGKSDSLNLAVATGIVLYEIFNQKQLNQ
ncbi:MAG: RNA methyltransferase [Anaerolineaceae bacterium]